MPECTCLICGSPVPPRSGTGMPRKFCSSACKQRNAYYKRKGIKRPDSRKCKGCGSQFALTGRNPDGKLRRMDAAWCVECRPHGDLPMNQRTRRLHYRYGVSRERYDQAVQSGCEICGATGVKLHVDHDHSCCPGGYTCGECVRGFLCGPCNRAIGLFSEDLDRMLSAAAYVLQSRNVLGGALSRS